MIQKQEPHQFARCFQAWAAASPVADLTTWDDIVRQIKASFEGTSKQPYLVPPDSPLGKQAADLTRMNLVRIQAAHAPTTRRTPTSVLLDVTHRATLLEHSDGTRHLELENLADIQFPKQRFAKAVQLALFMFGTMREASQPQPQQDDLPPHIPLANLPTDITFPGLPTGINLETRKVAARLRIQLGHPTKQELGRMLAYYGQVPNSLTQAVQRMTCATCTRLAPPQPARPTTLAAGQFADEIQGDIFYVRALAGQAVPILGLLDKATGFHMAAVLPSREANTVYQTIRQLWLKPYGLPYLMLLDPDPCFKGACQEQIESLGIRLEFCPAEARWMIGAIERRNSVLRMDREVGGPIRNRRPRTTGVNPSTGPPCRPLLNHDKRQDGLPGRVWQDPTSTRRPFHRRRITGLISRSNRQV